MTRLPPLPPETTPDLKPHFDFFIGTPPKAIPEAVASKALGPQGWRPGKHRA